MVQREYFRGMGLALFFYLAAMAIFYFISAEKESIISFYEHKRTWRLLLPVFTLATIPNVLFFMYFIRKNWARRARGVLTMVFLALLLMAFIKFVL